MKTFIDTTTLNKRKNLSLQNCFSIDHSLITMYQFCGVLTTLLHFRWYHFSLLNTNIENMSFFFVWGIIFLFYLLLPPETSIPTPFLYHTTCRGLFFTIYESNTAYRCIVVKERHQHFLDILHYISVSFVLLSFFVQLSPMCVCLTVPFLFVGSELQQHP